MNAVQAEINQELRRNNERYNQNEANYNKGTLTTIQVEGKQMTLVGDAQEFWICDFYGLNFIIDKMKLTIKGVWPASR